MRFYKTPALLRYVFPRFTWRMPASTKKIYLTFDDGPVPEITEWVVELLAHYQAKATFFCVGENISRYPEIAEQVAADGHRLANHTFHHLDGWKTASEIYVQNIALCQSQLEVVQPGHAGYLFRPPHGRLRPRQFQKIKTDYRVIMWDVLTYDFDATLAPEACLRYTLKNTAAGSIVVFHDSIKAQRNMQYALPRFLDHFAGQGYRFDTL